MTPWLLCFVASVAALGGLGEVKAVSEELAFIVKKSEPMAREKAPSLRSRRRDVFLRFFSLLEEK